MCRQYFEELYDNGTANIDSVNQAAHLLLLALGCQSLSTTAYGVYRLESSTHHNTAEQLYENARRLGYKGVEMPSLLALALLLALSIYQMATRRFGLAWTTFGTCVRHAQAIGRMSTLHQTQVLLMSNSAFSASKYARLEYVTSHERRKKIDMDDYIPMGHIPQLMLWETSCHSRSSLRRRKTLEALGNTTF
jgi:hypothetical protein